MEASHLKEVYGRHDFASEYPEHPKWAIEILETAERRRTMTVIELFALGVSDLYVKTKLFGRWIRSKV